MKRWITIGVLTLALLASLAFAAVLWLEAGISKGLGTIFHFDAQGYLLR